MKRRTIYQNEQAIIDKIDGLKATAALLAVQAEQLHEEMKQCFITAEGLLEKSEALTGKKRDSVLEERNKLLQRGHDCKEEGVRCMKQHKRIVEVRLPELKEALAASQTETRGSIMGQYRGVAV